MSDLTVLAASMRPSVLTLLLVAGARVAWGMYSSPRGPSKKLYDDQRAAWERRSQVERDLLGVAANLLEPVFTSKNKPPKGTGFGAKAIAAEGPLVQRALQQAEELAAQGVLRINSCITKGTAAVLRTHVLHELAAAKAEVESGVSSEQSRFGVELGRKFRADLLLSLLRPTDADNHPVAFALEQLLGSNGSLRPLYEKLVGKRCNSVVV